MGIKFANTKYELNRLQREHIKLQLEQEKYLEKLESFSESSNQREEEKSGIVTSEEKMDGKRNKVKMFECYFKRGYPVSLEVG